MPPRLNKRQQREQEELAAARALTGAGDRDQSGEAEKEDRESGSGSDQEKELGSSGLKGASSPVVLKVGGMKSPGFALVSLVCVKIGAFNSL